MGTAENIVLIVCSTLVILAALGVFASRRK